MGLRGRKQENLIGQRFGKLTVIEMIDGTKEEGPTVRCQCDCGNQTIVQTNNLKKGNTKSCGCLVKEARIKADKERREGIKPKTTYHRYKSEDCVGQHYGHLTILKLVGKNSHGQTMAECRCDCGKVITVRMSSVRSGNTQSCGCYRSIVSKKNHMKHGGCAKDSADKRLYGIWSTMKERCTNKKLTYAHIYIERGISVCEEWQHWENFRDWAWKNGYNDSLTIDRIHNDRGYSPDNCRWLTPQENSNNKRNNLYIQFDGQIKSCADWSRELGISYDELYGEVRALLNNACMVNANELPPMNGDYGYLTVVKDAGKDASGNRLVVCQCICGSKKTYRLSRLKSGRTLSCGCMRAALIAAKRQKHGASRPDDPFHDLYNYWKNVRNQPRFDHYVEVGLVGHDRQWDDWEKFKAWALSHGYERGKRLVRVDLDKPFTPDNCLWVVDGTRIFRDGRKLS